MCDNVCACALLTQYVVTVNVSSITLNMTLAICDIILDSHGPQEDKCSVSCFYPVVLNLMDLTVRSRSMFFNLKKYLELRLEL